MKTNHSRPWLLIWFLKLAGMKPTETTIFTWGSTVFSTGRIPTDLLTHETVHMRQQEGFLGPLRWWVRYARDPEFRFEQEAEAYGLQTRFIRERLQPRLALRALFEIADTLAGPMYGNICTQKRARERVQDWARVAP
jgi:hypothetical protein